MLKRFVFNEGRARIRRSPLAAIALSFALLCSVTSVTYAGAPQAMDPRGKVPGVADFSCPRPRAATNRFGYGIQSNWPVGDIGYWNSVMAGQLKMNWTRAKVNWHEFEPAPGAPNTFQFQLFDAFVADANRKGLNIVVTVTQPPAWTRVTPARNPTQRPSPPELPGEGVRFFRLIAARYKGCIQAIEVLNETNLDREWVVASGELRAADYVAFLREVTPVLRSIDRRLIIIMAAPSPTGANIPGVAQDDFLYLEDFVRAGGLNLVDCIGVHLNGYNMPPDKRWDEGYNDPTARFRGPFDNPHHSWSFISTIEGYRQRTNKPMCVTEFGWASAENLTRKDGSPLSGAAPGFDFALDNTEAEQAAWIVNGFQLLRRLGYVRFGIVFNLDFIQKIGQNPDEPGGDPALYSVIRQNGAPRPAFEALRDMRR
ncbi:MAG: hypothetical protein KatS3mg053_2126 [Candidatus Roseilinea sp.]|nr:MAG: hypothetical protein KatS3mg053_2126 [Candidatus Roseilinea sp.]